MFKKSLKALFKLSPYIVQGINETFIHANEGFSYTEEEFLLVSAKYTHSVKKLKKLGQFLLIDKTVLSRVDDHLDYEKEKKDGEFIITVDRVYLDDLCNLGNFILKKYEEKLQEDILPKILSKHFSINREINEADEKGIVESSGFKALDDKLLDQVTWMNKLEKFEITQKMKSSILDQEKLLIFNRIVDDAILALTRVYPDRTLNMSTEFNLIRSLDFRWELDHYVESIGIEFNRSSGNINVQTNIKLRDDRLVEFVTKFYDLHILYEITENNVLESTKQLNVIPVSQKVTNIHICNNLNENFKVTQTPKYKNISVVVELKSIYATISRKNIQWTDLAVFHKLLTPKVTYGNLLFNSKYEFTDPYFSVYSIYNNTIGSSQFSIEAAVTLLSAWVYSLGVSHVLDEENINNRYSFQEYGFSLSDFSNIPRNFAYLNKGAQMNEQQYKRIYNLLLSDLNFMKMYLPYHGEGNRILNDLLFCNST